MSESGIEVAVRVEGLRKSYGRSVALDGADLRVAEGESWALLGPNGSGKTTLLRIVATVTEPSGGGAWVFGMNVLDRRREVCRAVGYAPQAPTADLELTCAENLSFVAGLFGLSPAARRGRIAELLELFDIGEKRNALVGALSGGMRRRVELARSLIHGPRLLLLDEPSAGLDSHARERLWNLLERLRREERLTLVMATHRIEDAEGACDRVAILRRGRITGTARVSGEPPLAEIFPGGAEED